MTNDEIRNILHDVHEKLNLLKNEDTPIIAITRVGTFVSGPTALVTGSLAYELVRFPELKRMVAVALTLTAQFSDAEKEQIRAQCNEPEDTSDAFYPNKND
jgi:hypothetical protein